MNKKGFVLGGFIYMLMTLFLLLLLTVLGILATNKVSLDKIKDDVLYEIGEEKLHMVYEFDYVGNYQEFTAIESGYYFIQLWGAVGNFAWDGIPGKGAYVGGNVRLEKGQKLYFYVGNNNGYNGGAGAPKGGGATDVRLISGSTSNFNSLKSRIMVAAGGGGAERTTGGAGGTLIGYDAVGLHSGQISVATGGTQITGGIKGSGDDRYNGGTDGSFGIGGSGASSSDNGGGGGGGYYGGGGITYAGSGGGGSSFVSGCLGCNAISEASTSSNIIHTNQPNHYSGLIFESIVMIDGNSDMKLPNGDFSIGNTGNGFARIQFVG